MALHQLPAVEATITVTHTGPVSGDGFTTILSASDGAPIAPQQTFTFDLTVFAPDLVAAAPAAPLVGVFREPTGERVNVDIDVDPTLITVTFFEPVDPALYRIKVVG